MALGQGGSSGKRINKMRSEFTSQVKNVTEIIKQNTNAVKQNSEAIAKNAVDIRKFTDEQREALLCAKEYYNITVKNNQISKKNVDWLNKQIAAAKENNIEISKQIHNQHILDKRQRESAQETENVAKAQERSSKATKKNKLAVTELRDSFVSLDKSMKTVLETMNSIQGIMKSGGLRVQVDNAGFKGVLDELSKAVTNFHRRKGNGEKNFFDRVLGTREENQEASKRVISEAKEVTTKLENVLGNTLTESLEKKLSRTISEGIKKGVETGARKVVDIDPTAKMVGALLDESNASQPTKARVLQSILGKNDTTAIALERVKQNAKARIEYRKIAAEADVRKTTAVDTRIAEMEYVDANPNSNSGRMVAARARKEEIIAQREQIKLEQELSKIEREKTNRVRNRQEAVRIEREMNEVIGDEGSKLQKLGQELVALQAKRREYLVQGDELNKINFAEVANNQRYITEKTKEWATEAYKVEHRYYQIEKIGKTMVNTLKFLSSVFQTTSATLSSVGGLWSTMRTSATSFFTYFTNSFRRAFSQVKSMAKGLFESGLEQREKIEQAQIGFAAFFGEDRVEAVTQAVRQQAAKTPIVNAGELADYVQQLAPVSGGNASLALNSSLGILKSLVYSGSDISEGEYVIKNIRDVIAKGKATAIDIRQFNRALPGLEKAISQMPDLAEFLDEEGKLNITKDNVKRVLDVFATLNTDQNSPLKQIEEKMLHTLDGMTKLFNEKKTTAMETILEKSGVFDLLYKVLGIATDDGMWSKIADFLSKVLQPIVYKLSDILTNTNWGALGKKLSEYWSIIKEGIKEAKKIVVETGKDIFGGANSNDIFKRIARIIASFIKGLGEGISKAMKFAQWLANVLSGGDLEKLAETIATYLVSPMGKIIQTILSIGANSFGAASRALSTMAKFVELFNKTMLTGISKNATKYGQAYATMYSQGGSFGNTMATNMLLAGNGASYSGTTKIKVSNSTGETVQEMGKFKAGLASATTALKTFGSKLLKGIAAGGIISLVGDAIGEGVKGLKIFGDASEDIGNAVKQIAEAIAFIAVGASIGGVAGGLIGAGAYLIKSLIDMANKVEEERKKLYEQTKETILDEAKQKYADTAMDILKENGVNIDTGSDAGKYAYERMKKWIDSADLSYLSPEQIANKAADEFAQALRFKNISKAITEVSLSDQYQNVGGNRVDLSSEQFADKRNQLADKIKYYRLLGDETNYGSMSNESIVRQFLGGDSITDKQLDMYMDKFSEYESSMSENTTNITSNLDTLGQKSDSLKESIDSLNKTIDEGREKLEQNEKENGHYNAMFPETELGISAQKKIKEWDKADDYIYTEDFQLEGMKVYHSDIQEAFQSKINDMSEKLLELKNQGLTDSEEYKSLQEEFVKVITDYHFWASNQYEDVGTTVKKLQDEYTWFSDELKKKVEEDYETVHHQFLWWGWDEKIRKTPKASGAASNGGGGGGGWNHGGAIRPIYRATGGEIGVDTVPAMLQPGEFVMRKSAVSKAGLSTMFALNRGDMASAARSLGARFSGNYNNSRNWSSTINNNQKTQTNYIKVLNRNSSSKLNSYYGLANRIALA